MRIILFFLLLIPIVVKSQSLTPVDLLTIEKIAETNSLPLVNYLVNILSKSKLKYINQSDSTGKEGFYTSHKYSDGENQTLIVTITYDRKRDKIFSFISYQLFDNSMYEGFKKYCTNYGMQMYEAGNMPDGTPFWLWNFKEDGDIYLRVNLILTVVKRKYGYEMVL